MGVLGEERSGRVVIGPAVWGRWGRAAGAAATLLGLVGCSDRDAARQTFPDPVEVTGRVLLRTGKPLKAGRVAFIPDGPTTALPAAGVIGPDGTFTLSTRKPNDGAMPGRYKVRIEPSASRMARPNAIANVGFPVKYVDEDSSGLLVTVTPGSNALEPIRLK